jgi:hypothetical protein
LDQGNRDGVVIGKVVRLKDGEGKYFRKTLRISQT